MRIVASGLAMLIDAGIFVLALSGLLGGEAPMVTAAILIAAAVAFALLGSAVLLQVLKKPHSLVRWLAIHLCWLIPLVWLLGSLDHGIISGLEILSLVLVAAICAVNYWALNSKGVSHA